MKRVKFSLIFLILAISMLFGSIQTPFTYDKKTNYGEKEVYYPDLSTQEIVWTKDTAGEINSLALSDDGVYIVVGNDANEVLLFNNTSSEPIWINNTGSPVRSVSISPNGTYCVAGCSNGNIFLFNTSNSNSLWVYDVGGSVSAIDFSINNKYFVAGTDDAYIHLFNLTGPIPMWSYNTVGRVVSVDISYDANTIVAGGYDTDIFGDCHIYVLNRTGDLLWTQQSHDILYSRVTSDGNYICGAGKQYGYMFNRTDSNPIWNKTIGVLYYGLGSIYGMEMSRNGKTIVFANQWSTTPTRIHVCNFDGSTIESQSYTWATSRFNAAISGNGRYAAYLNNFNTMGIRKRISNVNFASAGSHDLGEDIGASAYNYNGSYLAVGGENGKIALLFNNIKLLPFTLTTDAGTPDNDGDFNLNWEDPGNANNYTIYNHNSSITQINSTINITGVIISRSLSITGLTNGTYYYLILAKNEKYNLSSNCLKVEVLIPYQKQSNGDDDTKGGNILGYSLYSLFSLVLFVSLFLVVTTKKNLRKK